MADELGYVPPVVLAADTTDMQAGFGSRLEDALTKGVGTAAISGALSIYNTFLDYTGKEAADTAETIRTYDSSWGDYYLDNKQTIDIAGFIGTSLVPGTLGVKGMKLLQAGKAEGAMARATGFFSSRRDEALTRALQELGRQGGTITADITAAKRAQLGWAVADNVLTSAAGEAAIALTMNDSPIFEGDDFWDFAKNMAIGAAFGGVVGGVFEHAAARGVVKQAQLKVEGARRDFDTIFDAGGLGMKKAEEITNFVDNIVLQGDDFYDVPFTYMKPGGKAGEKVTLVLDTTAAFKSARDRSQKVAFDTLASKFNELAGGGEVTGQAFHGFIYKLVQNGRAAGKKAEDIAEEVRGYLQGTKRIDALTDDAAEAAEQPAQFFVNNKPTGLNDLFVPVRGADTGKQAYYLTTTDPAAIKFASARMGFENAQEAFDAGYDAVFTKAGKVSVNPKSQVIKSKVDDALNSKFFLDLETGQLSPDVVKTGADLLRKGSDFIHLPDEVRIAGKTFKQAASEAADLTADSVKTSARFMWASQLPVNKLKGLEIAHNDFALLDRLRSIDGTSLLGEKAPKIKMADGSTVSYNDIVDPVAFVNRLKLEWLADTLGKEVKGFDVRQITNALNVSRSWFEEAVASNYASSRKLLGEARQLEEYFKPQTVQMEWDTAAIQAVQQVGPYGPGIQASVILGHQYALMTRARVNANAADSVLGEDSARFLDLDTDLARQATSQGAGATTFGASNADYGRRAELAVQDTGKQVALVQQKWKDETIGTLAPAINAVRDSKEAAAELGVLTTALRRDPRKYRLVQEVADADEGLESTYRLVDEEAYVMAQSDEFGGDIDEAIAVLTQRSTKENPIRGEYAIKNRSVGDFLDVSTKLNRERLSKLTTLSNAAGQQFTKNLDTVYVPPVDTAKFNHFAFVVAKAKIGAATDVSMITAQSADQLRDLAARVGDEYEVIYKSDTERFYKAKGQYDYDMTINESKVNSQLQRRGVLSDFFPETRAENVLEDYVRWHANSSDHVVRTAVQVKNRQFFSELQWLSDRYRDATESTFSGRGFTLRKQVADPFGDYIKTALNVSKRSEYPLLDSLNEFVDKVGTSLYKNLDRFQDEIRGSRGKDLVSLEQANKLMEDAGLGTPYKTMEEYLTANERVPKNAIKIAFQKANLFLATAVLRLDFANSLVNIISTPIMLGTELRSIRSLIAKDPETAGKLAELTRIKVPGQDASVPGMGKLIGGAINNFFSPQKQQLLRRYSENGDIKDVLTLYHDVLEDLSYMPNRAPAEWVSKVERAVEKGATITGNNFSEQFTRFISADVMRQLTEPLVEARKMTIKEQNAYISTFVNRVQGNYISSQRPVLFQGTTGAAIGLFQTYGFNVLQQLFRHMENRDTRTLLTFAGLQTSIYGMNGLPFFDAINQHLVGNASGNTGHLDAYSVLPAANKELGNWLLYGTASAFPLLGDNAPALYSRGDINPRHISIVPINPLDIPAVSASIKLVDTMRGFGKKVASGADVSESMLQALEHHGLNRPLAGFAQLLNGKATTSRGSLISAANDMETTTMLARIPERLVEFGGVARLMGAKPMDEAVALNNLYRNKAYEAVDRARLEALGSTVKTKLYANQMPDSEEMDEFMASYVKAGGRIENFSGSLQRWMRDANQSVVNQMADKLNSSSGRKMQSLMGGEPLEDYRTLSGQEPDSAE